MYKAVSTTFVVNTGKIVLFKSVSDNDGAHSAIVVGGGDDVMGILDYCALYNPVKRRCGGHDCTVLL